MMKVAEISGQRFTIEQTRDFVQFMVGTISEIHFGGREVPRVVHDANMEYPTGALMNCAVCRKKNIQIETNGCCSNCGLHSIAWCAVPPDE